jgi:16S rRNA (adenine1518-N6/adenine1519-N6)-dimethyltransferase
MHTKQELDARMRDAGIQPLKKLGQNFLLNPRICQGIVDATAAFNPKTVVEIGPGLGALTDELIKGSWTTILLEIDAGLVKYWQARCPEMQIKHEDALKTDWAQWELQQPAVLVSNLPYSIAGSLVIELSDRPAPVFSGLVLMFQKEVAERIEAGIGDEDYGLLSVVAQGHWDIKKLIDAGPQDFFPVPNVGSRVLQFSWKDGPHPGASFTAFVKLAFSQRRKKLMSNLQGGYPKDKIAAAFQKYGLSDNSRAQELSPEGLLRLHETLQTS